MLLSGFVLLCSVACCHDVLVCNVYVFCLIGLCGTRFCDVFYGVFRMARLCFISVPVVFGCCSVGVVFVFFLSRFVLFIVLCCFVPFRIWLHLEFLLL